VTRKRRLVLGSVLLVVACALTPVYNGARHVYGWWRVAQSPHGAMPPLPVKSPVAAKILADAKTQIGTLYDASYRTIAYPMGDVETGKGACTDVVIRSLRAAGYDLQSLVHEDMKAHWQSYPKTWHLSAPNPNIDHRRVPNQMAYLRRHAVALPLSTVGSDLQTWQPGDIVYWNTGNTNNTRLHTGIVSDTRNEKGEPFVIHNGSVCVEDDALTRWRIIGHFRFPRN
jgi:uncharacterized protein YijF (DUF1287 family)